MSFMGATWNMEWLESLSSDVQDQTTESPFAQTRERVNPICSLNAPRRGNGGGNIPAITPRLFSDIDPGMIVQQHRYIV